MTQKVKGELILKPNKIEEWISTKKHKLWNGRSAYKTVVLHSELFRNIIGFFKKMVQVFNSNSKIYYYDLRTSLQQTTIFFHVTGNGHLT